MFRSIIAVLVALIVGAVAIIGNLFNFFRPPEPPPVTTTTITASTDAPTTSSTTSTTQEPEPNPIPVFSIAIHGIGPAQIIFNNDIAFAAGLEIVTMESTRNNNANPPVGTVETVTGLRLRDILHHVGLNLVTLETTSRLTIGTADNRPVIYGHDLFTDVDTILAWKVEGADGTITNLTTPRMFPKEARANMFPSQVTSLTLTRIPAFSITVDIGDGPVAFTNENVFAANMNIVVQPSRMIATPPREPETRTYTGVALRDILEYAGVDLTEIPDLATLSVNTYDNRPVELSYVKFMASTTLLSWFEDRNNDGNINVLTRPRIALEDDSAGLFAQHVINLTLNFNP